MVQLLVSRDDNLVGKRDAAGALAVHLAYVFQHYHVGHYLVETYPEMAVLPYNSHLTADIISEFPELAHEDFDDTMMPYAGATILHIAIVRRNFEEVRWLLDYYYNHRDVVPEGLSILLGSNATGKFFAIEGNFYIGGFPLQFAAGVNHPGIFDLILAYASRVRLIVPETHSVTTEDSSSRGGGGGNLANTLADGVQGMKDAFSSSSRKLLRNHTFSSGSMKQRSGMDLIEESDKVQPIKTVTTTGMEPDSLASTTAKLLSGEEHEEESMSAASGLPNKKTATAAVDEEKQRTIAGENLIFMSDLNGNTVLHLCVLYGLQDMYQHVFDAAIRIMTMEMKALYSAYMKRGVGATVRTQSIPQSTCGYMMLPKVVNIPERDKYDEWVKAEARAKVEERLVLALNKDMHSPLTLAAYVIENTNDEDTQTRRIAMLQYLLHHMKQPMWSYGAVKMSRVKLEGIEIRYKLERYQRVPEEKRELPRYAAIDWLCINNADPRAIMLPEISQFIETKWERCGYPSFLVRFVIHSILTFMVTMIILFINSVPGFHSGKHTVGNVFMEIFYPLLFVGFGWIAFCELLDFGTHGWNYLAFRGAAKFDKIMRVLKVVSFWFFFAFKVQDFMNGENVMDGRAQPTVTHEIFTKVSLSICVICSWMHVYYFLMGFDSTGPFTLTIFRIVGRNVPYFLRFYAIVVVAFACALSLLSNDGTVSSHYGFWNILTAGYSLVQYTVDLDPTHNSIETTEDVPKHLQWLADLLVTLYFVSVVILMINLLIAMITKTYEEYMSYNAALLMVEKYNIMSAMERSMSTIEYERYRTLYSHREKIQIDSLTLSTSAKNLLVRALSHSFGGSSKKPGSGDFAKHATIESSNYYFEMQDLNRDWWKKEVVQADVILSKKKFTEPAQTVLFILNPQNDFYPGGVCAVPDAGAGSARIAKLVREHGSKFSRIIVAMATHQYCHISHASSWMDARQQPPAVGTRITYKSLLEGDWQPRSLLQQEWCEQYTMKLESNAHRHLRIQPEHCIIGTQGHAVNSSINSALQDWASRSKRTIQYLHYGLCKRTQMYSALGAFVEDPQDSTTGLNSELLNTFTIADQVLITGPAMCGAVQFTVRHLIDHWDTDLSKLVILKDGGASLPANESEYESFLSYAECKGCSVSTCSEVAKQ